MFNKSKENVKTNNEEASAMTYVEIVSEELNYQTNRLMNERKRLTCGINELLAEIKKKGDNTNSILASTISNLREKEKCNEKEIQGLSQKYEVDSNLLIMAGKLDSADDNNKGMDLIFGIGTKVNEIISMFPEIEKCYGYEIYAPSSYTMIKRSIEGLVMSMNNELPKLQKVDKKALLQKFNERKLIVDEEAREVQLTKYKYNIL